MLRHQLLNNNDNTPFLMQLFLACEINTAIKESTMKNETLEIFNSIRFYFILLRYQ